MIFALIAFILFIVGGILACLVPFRSLPLALGLFGLAVLALADIAKVLT